MLSVIIPALNEAQYIGKTLEALADDARGLEVLVADGGSVDSTRREVTGRARVIDAPRGRARQMNAGAAAARGDRLLFLHADTTLPPGAIDLVRDAFHDPRVVAGTFRLRFDVDTPLLRFFSFCSRLPWPSICFGDRALFVRRSAFEAVGGFPDIPIFEDLEMVRRLHIFGRFRYLRAPVTTSARRFLQDGTLRQQIRNARLWLQYRRGADPHVLAARYRYDLPTPQATL